MKTKSEHREHMRSDRVQFLRTHQLAFLKPTRPTALFSKNILLAVVISVILDRAWKDDCAVVSLAKAKSGCKFLRLLQPTR